MSKEFVAAVKEKKRSTKKIAFSWVDYVEKENIALVIRVNHDVHSPGKLVLELMITRCKNVLNVFLTS
jgi:hypothetical protein